MRNMETPLRAGQARRTGFSGWSPCAKCGSICCCMTLIVIVVMLPVTSFVIVPKMAQSTMDNTKVSLSPSIMILPKDFFQEQKTLTVHNKVVLDVPGPLGATIHSFKATMQHDGKEMGYFQFPELHAKVGKNEMDFEKVVTVTNGPNAMTFASMMMMPGAAQSLEITGDPEVTAVVFNAKPHQNVKLTCVGNGSTTTPEMTITMYCDPATTKTLTTTTATTTTKTAELQGPAAQIASALMPATLPDCSKTACPAKCTCGEQHCAAEINACLADPSCSGGEACADACPCGSMSCLATCAAKHPSAKGFAVLSCVSKACPQEAGSMAVMPVASEAFAPAALPDCSKTTCPAKCTCGEQHCATEINACLADPGCSGGEACADACPCGSMSCLAACAAKHPSAKGFAVLSCVSKACPQEARSPAVMPVVSKAFAPAAMPDCSKTACPAKCTCSEQHCATEINACLADPSCSGGEACADACPCGSMSCLAACAAKHPSAKGFAVLSCVSKACPQEAGSMAVPPVVSKAFAPAALPDCSKTACPAKCTCGEQHCATEINACLADPSCSGGEACADACPCGSMSCLAACAAKHPSAKGFAVLSCVSKACPQEAGSMAVAPVASKASAPAALPDCSKTACPAKCTCGEQHCATEINACLADPSCSGGEACADACPCGSMSCLAACAAQHPSAKGFAVLSCVSKACPNQAGISKSLVV